MVSNEDAFVHEPTKEYILVIDESEPQFIELGDVNPSTQAISALEKKHDQQVATINAYTVNGQKISENPVLDGADIKITGYSKGSSTAAIAATDTVNAAIAKLENRVAAAQIAADGGVQSVGGKTGAITVRGSQTANGTVNLTMSNNQLQASIVGLKSAAFTESSAYAAAGDFQTLSNLVGQNNTGSATGIFKIIEDNEKTTAKALTDLDTRLQEVNSILE